MTLDIQLVADMPSANHQDYVLTQKNENSSQPLFSYMNANLEIPGDGTIITYMNADSSAGGSSGSGGSCTCGGGGCVCIA